MRILVTGGTGFLGSYIVEALKNHEVTTLSRTGDLKVDIRNKKDVVNSVKGFDIVVHSSGNLRTPATDTKDLHFGVNSEGTLNLLEACRTSNVGKFVFVSSASVYGLRKLGISEVDSTKPIDDYGKSKLLGEYYCSLYSEDLEIAILRPSYIYGKGMYEGRFIVKLIKNALGKKERLVAKGGHDFVCVKDVASFVSLLCSDFKTGVFNLTSGHYTEMKKIFGVLELEFTEENSNNAFSYDNKKALSLGFKPRSVVQGIREMYNEMENTVV